MQKIKYVVTAEVKNIHGGIPSDQKLLMSFMEYKEIPDKIQEEMLETIPEGAIEEAKSRILVGFRKDEKGLFLSHHQIKKCFEEVSTSSRMNTEKEEGVKGSFKQVFQHRTLINPERIHLFKDPDLKEHFTEPPFVKEFRHPVKTMRGERTVIGFNQMVDLAYFQFEVEIFANDSKIFSEKRLIELLEGMEVNGLGSARKIGVGKVKILIVRKEEFETEKIIIA